jgi:hypothetical protein
MPPQNEYHMKKNYLTALLLFSLMALGTRCYAQPSKSPVSGFVWGENRKEHPAFETLRVLGAVNQSLYYFNRISGPTSKQHQYFIDEVDFDLKVKKRMSIAPKFQSNSVRVEDVLRIKDQIFIIAVYMDKETKTKYILSYPLDLQTGTLAQTPIKAVVADFSEQRLFEGSAYDIEFSLDSSWFVINYTLPRSADGNERFGFQVFDDKFNPVWGRIATLDYREKLFEIVGHRVDDDGDVYILGRLFAEKKVEIRNKKVNYEYRLIGYRKQDPKPYFYDLDLERSFPGSVTIIPRGNEIVCMGFYSDITPGHAQGCFTITFEKMRKQLVKYSKLPFDLEFIAINLSESEKKKFEIAAKESRAEIPYLEINGLILREDQSVVVVAEQHYVKVGENTTQDQRGGGAAHYYKDIVIFSIDANFKIEWYEKIPKKQVTRNDAGKYSSFHPMPGGERIYFLYNDHKDNFKAVRIGLPKLFKAKTKDSQAVVAQMEYAGTISKYLVFNSNRYNLMVQPQISGAGRHPSEILLVARKGKRQRYGMMQLEAPASPGRRK